jgi:hypothetical protein
MHHGGPGGHSVNEDPEKEPLRSPQPRDIQPADLLLLRVAAEGPLTKVKLSVEVVIGRDRPNHHVSHKATLRTSCTTPALGSFALSALIETLKSANEPRESAPKRQASSFSMTSSLTL